MKRINIEKETILEQFKLNISKTQIAKNLEVSSPTLRKFIKKYGIEDEFTYKPELHAKRSLACNLQFFDLIDTEEKAYILGFLLGDGWITSNGRTLGFAVTETDKELLYRIKDAMGSEHKIRTRNFSKAYENSKPIASLEISSTALVRSLVKLGITSNKSFDAVLPKLQTKELTLHLLRGLFDADGSFSQNNPCITTASKALVEDITGWVNLEYGFTPSTSAEQKVGGTKIYYIYFRKNLSQLLIDMYKINKISLARKQESFDNYYKFRMKNQ